MSKVVLITGAASGIGAAIARAFAEPHGVSLALLDLNGPALSALATQLRVPVRTAVADLSTEMGVRQGVQEVLSSSVDVVILNVGKLFQGKFLELPMEQWRQSFAINFFSHIATLQATIPRMVQGGSVIFIGSDQGLQPDASLSAYATAKSALHSLTKVLAIELASSSIRVNAVAPGMTRTPLVEQLMQGYAKEFGTDVKTAERRELQRRGLTRLVEPEEVADAVLYLDHSPNTGTILNMSLGNVRTSVC